MPTSLKSLMTLMKTDGTLDWSSLPVFGGEEPASTLGVWSWDETHLLVGECADDLAIVPRPNVPAHYDVVQYDLDEGATYYVVTFNKNLEPVNHPVCDMSFVSQQDATLAGEKTVVR